ncbi:MAG: PEP-CTERM sorting domain-containing protein [Sedimentisphaerales bacterium]
MRAFVCGTGLIIIGLACAQVCLAEGASFRGLGDLSGGDFYSEAHAVSAYGNAVVGVSSSANGSEAFIWTEATGMIGLGDLPGGNFWSQAWGVSCDGSYVVGCGTIDMLPPFQLSQIVPCRWSGQNNVLPLGQDNGVSWNISADGMTVVGDSSQMAFRWTEANGIQALGHLPGRTSSEAYGVSANGKVVVGDSYDANGFEAFYWTEATGMVGLGYLSGSYPSSSAWNVSEDGLVIVGESLVKKSPTVWEAFIWKEGGRMNSLGQLPDGGGSVAWSVSGDGTVVVGDVNNERLAFIWDANHGMQNLKDVLENAYGLNLGGWRLLCAADISADGRVIVGWGKDPNGFTQAWMADIGTQQPPSVKLTVQVEPNDVDINTITPVIGEHLYYTGWPVILKAETFKKCPDVYRFSHWTGDVGDPNSATTTLVMTEDKTVKAVYYADQRRCGDECHPILQGDLNRDCYVNFEDFAIYCQQWMACTHPDCD